MTTIFLVFLFHLQIISFYFLALLYTKVSKFDDLEKKQRKLMDEMDDSIGAYLSELKDENERLIERLAERRFRICPQSNGIIALWQHRNRGEGADKEHPKVRVNTPKIPINLALKSYNAVTAATETAFAQVPSRKWWTIEHGLFKFMMRACPSRRLQKNSVKGERKWNSFEI